MAILLKYKPLASVASRFTYTSLFFSSSSSIVESDEETTPPETKTTRVTPLTPLETTLDKFHSLIKDQLPQESSIEHALNKFHHSIHLHFVNTYKELISMFCGMGHWKRAYRLLNEMVEEKNLKPSNTTYQMVLDCLRKAGQLNKHRDIVDMVS